MLKTHLFRSYSFMVADKGALLSLHLHFVTRYKILLFFLGGGGNHTQDGLFHKVLSRTIIKHVKPIRSSNIAN